MIVGGEADQSLAAPESASLARRYVGHQLLKTCSALGVLGGDALIAAVDDEDLFGLPGKFTQPLGQRALIERALAILSHLLGVGLPQVNDRTAFQVSR